MSTRRKVGLIKSNVISRRAVVGGLGAAAASAAITRVNVATAAESTPIAGLSHADHPMAGTWMVMSNPSMPDLPQGGNVASFAVDGTVTLYTPPTDLTPDGVVYASESHGIWEPETPTRIHFTAVKLQSNADGYYVGSVTVDGHPEASEDGQTFTDTGELVQITLRDVAGDIVAQFPGSGGRPVNGLRMTLNAPSFPAPVPPMEA